MMGFASAVPRDTQALPLLTPASSVAELTGLEAGNLPSRSAIQWRDSPTPGSSPSPSPAPNGKATHRMGSPLVTIYQQIIDIIMDI